MSYPCPRCGKLIRTSGEGRLLQEFDVGHTLEVCDTSIKTKNARKELVGKEVIYTSGSMKQYHAVITDVPESPFHGFTERPTVSLQFNNEIGKLTKKSRVMPFVKNAYSHKARTWMYPDENTNVAPSLIFAVDFDGTCVTNNFPDVGEDIGAQAVLKELVANNHKLILWTVRSGSNLEPAVEWFKKNEIPLFGIADNPFYPSGGRKVHADCFIDDRALGCPLNTTALSEPFVDWFRVRQALVEAGFIKEKTVV